MITLTWYSLLFIILIACIAVVWIKQLDLEFRYAKEPRMMKNFPFKYHNKTYWYNRGVASAIFAFCKDKKGDLYVLANQRGKGTPDFQGYWNCPCGYIDFNETSEQAAVREAFEETGVSIPLNKVKLDSVNSDPFDSNKQNITLRHIAMLDGTIDEYEFNTTHSEKDEVANIAWIKVSNDDVDKLKWAFNHDLLIKQCLFKLVTNKVGDLSAKKIEK